MAEFRAQVLPAIPNLGRLYGQAAAQLALVKSGRRALAKELPSDELVVRDVEVDVRGLTGFQHLVGARATDVVPPSYLHVLGFPLTIALMSGASSPVVAVGMVHIRNHAEQLAPVRLGEALTFRARLQNLAPHRRGTTVDAVVDAYRGEERVFTTVSTHLAKGNFVAGRLEDEQEERPEFVPPALTARWRVSAADVRAYAEYSGDRNPIHMNALAAKAFGFPSIIAHGMFSAAKSLAAVDPRVDAYAWDVSFAAPVVVPATVSVGVRIRGDDSVATGWNAKKKRLHFESRVAPLATGNAS